MAKFKLCPCIYCGEPMLAAAMTDVWEMRIDGVLHSVPVTCIPANRCEKCDIYTVDGTSDEAVLQSYTKYINEHGLNTLWHRLRRAVRRRIERWQYWYWNRVRR
jgi:hypothetical protein